MSRHARIAPRAFDTSRLLPMTHAAVPPSIMSTLDGATRTLVRLAAVVTAGEEDAVRAALVLAVDTVPPLWVEELLLQTYLFAGFPRALNATREWRRISGRAPLAEDGGGEPATSGARTRTQLAIWREQGEATCARVYGPMYARLRANIRDLHPALDDWMVVEGYGKVLSRPGLDLGRRELCIVAACAAAGQERQLLSHLHGSLSVGVPAPVVDEAVEALAPVLDDDRLRTTRMLWARVRGK